MGLKHEVVSDKSSVYFYCYIALYDSVKTLWEINVLPFTSLSLWMDLVTTVKTSL
jgi:hypothetical protein